MDFEKAQKKAKELVSQMNAEEKMSQLLFNSPAIERLNINEYNWWNEASHGIARAGVATVFPHAIGMAATFDKELVNTSKQTNIDKLDLIIKEETKKIGQLRKAVKNIFGRKNENK